MSDNLRTRIGNVLRAEAHDNDLIESDDGLRLEVFVENTKGEVAKIGHVPIHVIEQLRARGDHRTALELIERIKGAYMKPRRHE